MKIKTITILKSKDNCNNYVCEFAPGESDDIDELGCYKYIRRHLVEILRITENGIFIERINCSKARCIDIVFPQKKERTYVCIDDVLAFLVKYLDRNEIENIVSYAIDSIPALLESASGLGSARKEAWMVGRSIVLELLKRARGYNT